jgi:hypothetical protein
MIQRAHPAGRRGSPAGSRKSPRHNRDGYRLTSRPRRTRRGTPSTAPIAFPSRETSGATNGTEWSKGGPPGPEGELSPHTRNRPLSHWRDREKYPSSQPSRLRCASGDRLGPSPLCTAAWAIQRQMTPWLQTGGTTTCSRDGYRLTSRPRRTRRGNVGCAPRPHTRFSMLPPLNP